MMPDGWGHHPRGFGGSWGSGECWGRPAGAIGAGQTADKSRIAPLRATRMSREGF